MRSELKQCGEENSELYRTGYKLGCVILHTRHDAVRRLPASWVSVSHVCAFLAGSKVGTSQLMGLYSKMALYTFISLLDYVCEQDFICL